MNKTQASILFDLDGTVTDSGLGIIRSFNHALVRLGLSEQEPTSLQRYIGPPLSSSFGELLPNADEELVSTAIAFFRERYFDVGWRENAPYPGIRQALETLANSGRTILICTNKRTDIATRIIDHFGLMHFFDGVYGCGLSQTKAALIAQLLEERRCGNNSWMVGDRHSDIASGQENGLRTLGVAWGFGSRRELENAAPTAILGTPEELAKFKFDDEMRTT